MLLCAVVLDPNGTAYIRMQAKDCPPIPSPYGWFYVLRTHFYFGTRSMAASDRLAWFDQRSKVGFLAQGSDPSEWVITGEWIAA